MATQKRASGNPADFMVGGAVPDGRYTIKSVSTDDTFDYQGKSSKGAVPTCDFTFVSAQDGAEFTQHYSAGDLEYLVPDESRTGFVHPRGEDAKIGRNTNFGKFLIAIINAGFPATILDAGDFSVLAGSDVELLAQAQPKGSDGKDKTLTLPTKYYGKVMAGAKRRPTQTASRGSASSAARTAAPTATASPSNNGDNLDADTVTRVQEALAVAADNTMSVVKLGTTVWLTAQRDKNANVKLNAKSYKDRAGNAEWLDANAEAGGWVVDGDQVTGVPQ